jgi:hypothetical protein
MRLGIDIKIKALWYPEFLFEIRVFDNYQVESGEYGSPLIHK